MVRGAFQQHPLAAGQAPMRRRADEAPRADEPAGEEEGADEALRADEPAGEEQEGKIHHINVMFVGAAGLGKSTLLRAVLEEIAWEAQSGKSSHDDGRKPWGATNPETLWRQINAIPRGGVKNAEQTPGFIQYPQEKDSPGPPVGWSPLTLEDPDTEDGFKDPESDKHPELKDQYFEFKKRDSSKKSHRFKVRLIDTAGFDAGLESWEEYAERLRKFLRHRIRISGSALVGMEGCHRIHACVYMLEPHRFKDEHINIIEKLHHGPTGELEPGDASVEHKGLTVVYPVIAKSDAMTEPEKKKYTKEVKGRLEKLKLKPKRPLRIVACTLSKKEWKDGEQEKEHDEEEGGQGGNAEDRSFDREMGPYRKYEWGRCHTRHPQHSDLRKLVDLLFNTDTDKRQTKNITAADNDYKIVRATISNKQKSKYIFIGMIVMALLYAPFSALPQLFGGFGLGKHTHTRQHMLDWCLQHPGDHSIPVREVMTPYLQRYDWSPNSTTVYVSEGVCTRLRFVMSEECTATMPSLPAAGTGVGLIATHGTGRAPAAARNPEDEINFGNGDQIMVLFHGGQDQQLQVNVCDQSFSVNIVSSTPNERGMLIARSHELRNVSIDLSKSTGDQNGILMAVDPIEMPFAVVQHHSGHRLESQRNLTYRLDVRVSVGGIVRVDGECKQGDMLCTDEADPAGGIPPPHLWVLSNGTVSAAELGTELDQLWKGLRFAARNTTRDWLVQLTYIVVVLDVDGRLDTYMADTIDVKLHLPKTSEEKLKDRLDELVAVLDVKEKALAKKDKLLAEATRNLDKCREKCNLGEQLALKQCESNVKECNTTKIQCEKENRGCTTAKARKVRELNDKYARKVRELNDEYQTLDKKYNACSFCW